MARPRKRQAESASIVELRRANARRQHASHLERKEFRAAVDRGWRAAFARRGIDASMLRGSDGFGKG